MTPAAPLFAPKPFETRCTIAVEHTPERLYAECSLEDDLALGVGDRVRVHGPPVEVRFGERIVLSRPATVTRAGLLRRAWTRFAARFELAELYEVSFTPRRF